MYIIRSSTSSVNVLLLVKQILIFIREKERLVGISDLVAASVWICSKVARTKTASYNKTATKPYLAPKASPVRGGVPKGWRGSVLQSYLPQKEDSPLMYGRRICSQAASSHHHIGANILPPSAEGGGPLAGKRVVEDRLLRWGIESFIKAQLPA